MIEGIVLFSMCIQILAAILAIRYFGETVSKRSGWLFVSVAVFLMILRRFFGFLRVTSGEDVILIEEVIGFVTSCLLCLGLFKLGALFRFVRDSGEKIMASEKKYRSVFHGVSDVIFIVSHDGTILDCNEAAERLLGFSSESIKGANIAIFSHPDQLEPDALKKAISSGGKEKIDWTLVGSDGRKIEAELRLSQVIVDGEETILCVFRDRTEEKRIQRELMRSYEYLELVLDKNPIPIFTLDTSGRVVLWNTGCERLTGIPREKILGNKPDFKALYPGRDVPPSTLAELLLKFGPAFLAKKLADRGVSLDSTMPDTLTCETVFETEGTIKRVKLMASRLYDQKGKLIGAIQIAEDVTMERALERYASQAQRMESLGRLASGVAHDFRNILMIIKNSTELVKYKLRGNSEIERHSREIGIAVEQGVSLCRQLMGFAKEKDEGALQALDVNSIVRDLGRFIRRVFREDIHVQTELSDGIGKVRAYPGQIDRILINLFLNAQDAMPSGGTLFIKTGEVEVTDKDIPRGVENVKPGRFVIVTVRDTGVGMDEETIHKIFEPFFSSKKGTGRGLGLYVVWNEIRNLGGFIKVESSLSLGTAFHCYIPVWEEEVREAEEIVEESEETIKATGSKNILVVEDNLALRDIMVQTLRYLGHSVKAVGSVKEALYALEIGGENIDVLLSDVQLPDGNGYELIEEVQSKFPHIKFILMTGYTDSDITKRCYAKKIPVIFKPFSIEKLQEAIARLEDSAIIFKANNKNESNF